MKKDISEQSPLKMRFDGIEHIKTKMTFHFIDQKKHQPNTIASSKTFSFALMVRNKIQSVFLSCVMVRNGIPSIIIFRGMVRNGIPSLFNFREMVRKGIPNFFYLSWNGSEQYSEHFPFRGTDGILTD
jgi:hypothetical protein